MEPISIIDDIPEALRGRVALVNGVLHISAELKNNLQIVDFYGSLRRRGILTYEFHKPEEFDNTYQAQAAKTGHAENEIIQYAIDLIKDAFETGASDIHLMDFGLYTIIRFRCLGMLTDHTQLNAELGQRLIACIYQKLSQSADACFSPTERQDGRIAAREYLPPSVHSVRVHSEPIECAQAKEGVGTSMSLRLLYDATSAKGSLLERMTALGFTAGQCDTAQFLTRRTGLTIISGPTGHGKSTFLKHVMESMTERNPEKAYFSIEDPPEYPLKGVRQVLIASNDRGSRSGAYCDAIAGAMRSDPDVLMIGEIRYVEAAVAAIDAALTGHSVWATIHANNAMGIIARLVSILATHYRREREELFRKRHQAAMDALSSPLVIKVSQQKNLVQQAVGKSLEPEKNESRHDRPDLLDRLAGAGSSPKSDYDPAAEKDREAFFDRAKKTDRQWVSRNTRMAGQRFEVKTGAVIPAVMIGGINSELPGQIIAQVCQNVYDTADGRYLLIPQGARLYGIYDSRIIYGQSRVLIAWNRIIFPDGSSITLESMPGADSAGYSGFHDQVNNHYFRIFGGALLMSLFTGGTSWAVDTVTPKSTSSDSTPTLQQEMASSLATQFGQTTSKLLEKNINIKPTLEIRPGYRFNVIVTKDLVFKEPYRDQQ